MTFTLILFWTVNVRSKLHGAVKKKHMLCTKLTDYHICFHDKEKILTQHSDVAKFVAEVFLVNGYF